MRIGFGKTHIIGLGILPYVAYMEVQKNEC